MRHTFRVCNLLNHVLEGFRLDGGCGNTVLTFQRDAVLGDRRRTRASVAYGDDRRISLLLDFLEQRCISFRIHARLSPEFCPHVRHVLGEPGLHLLHQNVAIVKSAVD